MTSNLVPRRVLAALAGAVLAVAASTGPSTAFTLSAPSLAATADVQHVWWDRWGRWHPNRPWGWRRWGWGPRPYGFYGYYGPVRRCWVGPWGGMHCRWG